MDNNIKEVIKTARYKFIARHVKAIFWLDVVQAVLIGLMILVLVL